MPRARAPPMMVSRSLFPPEDISIRVLLIANDGGGFADHVEIADATRVEQLLAERMSGRKPADYLIRVNRLPAAADQVLRDGDRVSFTPTNIEGAAA